MVGGTAGMRCLAAAVCCAMLERCHGDVHFAMEANCFGDTENRQMCVTIPRVDAEDVLHRNKHVLKNTVAGIFGYCKVDISSIDSTGSSRFTISYTGTCVSRCLGQPIEGGVPDLVKSFQYGLSNHGVSTKVADAHLGDAECVEMEPEGPEPIMTTTSGIAKMAPSKPYTGSFTFSFNWSPLDQQWRTTVAVWMSFALALLICACIVAYNSKQGPSRGVPLSAPGHGEGGTE